MKKELTALLFLLGLFGMERATAQTFTFECVCDYVSSPDCDICNTQIQSRLLNGLLIRRSGTAFKWIEYPYMVRIQGTNAVIQELIFPNPETVTINLAGTGFADMSEYMDSLQCNCGGGSVSFIAGPGILISGDTISAVDTSATNEIQQVDTLLFSSDTLRISLSSDGVPQKRCISLLLSYQSLQSRWYMAQEAGLPVTRAFSTIRQGRTRQMESGCTSKGGNWLALRPRIRLFTTTCK